MSAVGPLLPLILHSAVVGTGEAALRYFPRGNNDQSRSMLYGKSQWITAQQAPLHSWHPARAESGTSSQVTFHASSSSPTSHMGGTGMPSSLCADEGQFVTPAAGS